MPHNFIRTSPYTPSASAQEVPDSQRQLRTWDEVASICTANGNGELENLWFDAPSHPQYAYVLFKKGDVPAIISALGGGEQQDPFYERDEVK